ncbi:SDR family NAD(P)-dependent oxidoreductase [Algibacillus agarilyticus]|uniref:SDR family NAD(P)-dependent oxidoreductase n=1 Tax=Algibacillus agarilyticus TaxID=2234133 RepID=UPI000DD016E6|nr:SDR family NAD(P)-dependent oxidoreductase [Algibacillus agarilyticus]
MKNILITGATSGIGLALTQNYVTQGCHVLACGRNADKLKGLDKELSSDTGHVTTLCFDINDKQAVLNTTQQLPELDIIILNAGDCKYIDDAVNFDAQRFESVIQTNLISIGYALQAWLNKLKSGGNLVFVSSSVTLLNLPRSQAYGASKAGLNYLANSLAVDLYPHNITVSLVQPGFIKTPLTDKNNFSMPFLISAEEAANRIAKGITKNKPVIQFPKRMIFTLKLLSFIPTGLWHKLNNKASTK